MIIKFKKYWQKIVLSIFVTIFLFAYFLNNSFALDNPYSPGQTLNPLCAPESPNCTVDTTQIESDPTVSTYIKGITESYFTNGNTAYSWGDHSLAGYITDGNTNWDNSYGFITSYTETDPVFTAWDKDYADLTNTPTIPTLLSQLSEDTTHRLVTDTEKSTWNGKQDALTSGTNIKTINGSSVLGTGDLTVGLISDADLNTKGGTNAGLNLVSGAQYNTFLGYEAGLSSATLSTNGADYNTAIGYRALYSNTTGNSNTASGVESLRSNTTGHSNTANGTQSLFSNTTGYSNIANGYQSLYSNTTGNSNTANGTQSLFSNTTGNQNTANGSFSLRSNITGSYNTANGYYSLFSNTTGNRNISNGYESLHSNTTGSSNTANGVYSLSGNSTGSYNTANGYQSLYNSGKTIIAGSFITGVSYTIISTGTTNFTACGASNSNVGTVFTATGPCSGTGTASSNSNNNIGIGYQAGMYIANGSTVLTSPSNSIFLGAGTKALTDGSTNEIVIGYNTTGNGSNTATIGNTFLLRTYLTGVNIKAGTATAGTAPLKLSAGTNLTTTEAGAIEYDGTHLYFTATNGGPRHQLDQQGGGLIVGTTGITSGTSGNILYNNAGTLGEMTTSGTGTQLALTTSPSFTTPSLGVATATSINGVALSTSAGATNFLAGDGTYKAVSASLLSDTYFNTKGGTSAGANLVAGAQYNTFLGYEAGKSSATLSTNIADFNTAVGYRALHSNTTGSRNTANGSYSLYSNTTGDNNTANGSDSLRFNTTGSYNTANGSYSLYFNTTGSYNTANGSYSLLSNTTGYFNTANGYYSLYSNTTGINNTANGYYSLYSNTTGGYNTANGYYSLYSNTTGSSNIANGYYSLYSNTTGSSNIANGINSLYSNTTGYNNIANGINSLYSNTTGYNNTANGVGSLANIGKVLNSSLLITGFSYTIQSSGDTDFTLCGASNSNTGTVFTATGPCSGTGTASSNSNNNIGIGYQAGMYIANGFTDLNAISNSIFLGSDTKALINGSENEIVIGYNATGHGSNTATWGATSITNHYFSGNVQYSSYGAGTLTTDASGNITTSSDERLKDIIGYYDNTDNTDNTETDKDTGNTNNITENQKSDLERIIEINPIIYKWNEKSGLETEHSYVGFSAQNLRLAIPEAVGLDKRIDPETGENYLTISDRPILATVVNAIKEMDLKVKDLASLDTGNSNSLGSLINSFLSDVNNQIYDLYAKIIYSEIIYSNEIKTEKLCVGSVCVTEEDFIRIFGENKIQDQDGDGIKNEIDNCPSSSNEGQEDEDEDGIGDICEEETSNPSITTEQEDPSGEEESGESQTEENTTDENNNIQTGEEGSSNNTALEQPESLELDPIATS